MIWHDHANKILDMQDRDSQIEYYKSLPEDIKLTVGNLVKVAQSAAKNHVQLAWRVAHVDRNTSN